MNIHLFEILSKFCSYKELTINKNRNKRLIQKLRDFLMLNPNLCFNEDFFIFSTIIDIKKKKKIDCKQFVFEKSKFSNRTIFSNESRSSKKIASLSRLAESRSKIRKSILGAFKFIRGLYIELLQS